MKKSILYTATGDKGTTSLVDGTRTTKDDVRVEAYGTLDELNSHIGLLRALAPETDIDADNALCEIQNRLFDIGTAFATPGEGIIPDPVSRQQIETLERAIDLADASTPPMRGFILPAGIPASCQAHIARTVCRRAERRAVTLSHATPVSQNALVYLNRLSDYLFALARYLNKTAGKEETLWRKA